MKNLLVSFLPLFIVFAVLLSLRKNIDDVFFLNNMETKCAASDNLYFDNLINNPSLEYTLFSGTDSSGVIYMFGSSELTAKSDALPFTFISKYFKNKVVGIGHAGNQCFSIYSQLLAHKDKLDKTPVFIILSPGWFANEGTTSECFLEYNSPTMMNKILMSEGNDEFKQYQMKRVSELYSELVNPDVNFRMMFLEDRANKSIVNRLFLSPLIYADVFLQNAKQDVFYSCYNNIPFYKNVLRDEHVDMPWDSLFAASKKEHEANATNNSWGVNNVYYSTYVNGKTTEMKIQQYEGNTEWQDLKMLLRLLKANKVNASFMILPINPYYYTNTKELTPFISKINTEVVKTGYPCLNMWNDDTTTFEKPILNDVMHLSSYGLLKVDQFLVSTYKLAQ